MDTGIRRRVTSVGFDYKNEIKNGKTNESGIFLIFLIFLDNSEDEKQIEDNQ